METVYQKFASYLKDVSRQFLVTYLFTKELTVDAIQRALRIDDLEERLRELDEEVYIEFITLNEQIEVIENIENDEKDGKVYDKYLLEKISSLLAESPLTKVEQVQVMLKILEKNIIWVEKANKAVDEYNNFFKSIAENTVLNERFKETLKIDNNEFKEIELQNKLLKEYYFDKKDTYSNDDIHKFIKVLNEMSLNPIICAAINSSLTKSFNQRKSYISRTTLINEDEPINLLPNKEYKKIYHEIKTTYFNIEDMKPIRYLSVPEIIEFISLLKKLNYKEKDIKEILTIIDSGNSKFSDTIDIVIEYADVMSRYVYYKSQLEPNQYMQNIDEYMNEWLLSSEDDSLLWESILKEEIDKLNSILPTTHEYEIGQAKKAIVLTKDRIK